MGYSNEKIQIRIIITNVFANRLKPNIKFISPKDNVKFWSSIQELRE